MSNGQTTPASSESAPISIDNAAASPPSPNMSEASNHMPQTLSNGQDTGAATRGQARSGQSNGQPCAPLLNANGQPVLTGEAALAWGPIRGGPRVHVRPMRGTFKQYGTAKLQAFLDGLNNIPGGEDIQNRPYMQAPAGKEQPQYKPGWYVGDCSRKVPGPTPGHVSHMSGIGFDLTIPRKNGGMTMSYRSRKTGKWGYTSRGVVFQNKSVVPRTEYDQRLLANGFDVDWNSCMQFLLYCIPWCKSIIWYTPHIKFAKNLAQDLVTRGAPGWTEEAYKRLFVTEKINGRRRRRLCSHSGCPGTGAVCHASHFHIRLAGPGLFDTNGNERLSERELQKYGGNIRAMGGWSSGQRRTAQKLGFRTIL